MWMCCFLFPFCFCRCALRAAARTMFRAFGHVLFLLYCTTYFRELRWLMVFFKIANHFPYVASSRHCFVASHAFRCWPLAWGIARVSVNSVCQYCCQA